MSRIYFDNAATTRVDDEVINAMIPFFTQNYAIASSIFSHDDGIIAQEAIEGARELILNKLSAKDYKCIFTSGPTESNNLAIKGLSFAKHSGNIVVSKIEDLSIINTVKFLQKKGFEIRYVDVDSKGFVNLDHLKQLIDDNTILVSIQHANQEIGTIQDLSAIGEICKQKNCAYHCDATFSFPFFDIDLSTLNIDMLTIGSDTYYGPKGASALIVKNSIELEPLITGGYQEYNLRAGTQNIPAIIGMKKAIEIFDKKTLEYIKSLKDYFLEKINQIQHIRINSPQDASHPSIVNVTFLYIEGESLTLRLNLKGVSVITGSACFSKSLEASHVLLSCGLTHELAHGSIRFSFGKYNTFEEIDKTIEYLKEDVAFLRRLSPLYKETNNS